MVREDRSPRQHLPGLLSVCVVVLLLAATAAGPSAAAPRVFVSGASKDTNTILAGESVNVTATVKNTGDSGGAIDIRYEANGTERATERVAVDAGASVKRTRTLTFDEPGRYSLTVESPEKSAGTVTVKRAIAETTREDAASRQVRIRGGAVPTTEPYDIEMPGPTNRTFAVETWTVNASQRTFTQDVTEYTDANASGLPVPSGDAASVFSVVTVGSTEGVEPSSMEFVLNRSNLRSAGISASEVRVYHRVNGSWKSANTSVVEERTDRVVYQADTSGASAYAIGKIEPTYSITRTSVVSERVPQGQQVVVEGTVRNDGGIEGTYNAQMSVDGAVVNETSVTIPANGERTVSLSTVVTTPGRFRVGFNDANAGVIQVTEKQVQTADGGAEPTATEGRTEPAAQTEPAVDDDDGGIGPLPASIFGISTILVIGGLVGALLLFGVLIAFLRRGGSRNNSGFEL